VVQSWYPLALSKELRRGKVLARELSGRPVALFRGSSGQAAALHGRCAHLGADLARGDVAGDCLRCPFHNWSYNAQGQCTDVPCQKEIPAFARTFAYPTRERYGVVWVFNGPQPTFELPAFEQFPDASKLAVLHVKPKPLRVHPHVITCNGLDVQHFENVHDFTFWEPPTLEELNPSCLRMRMSVRVPPANLFLRLLRLVAGDRIEASVTTAGGNLALIEAMAGPLPFLMLNTHCPLPDGGTLSRTILFNPKRPLWQRLLGLQSLALFVAVSIMIYLVRDDVRTLEGIAFRPRLIEADEALRSYIRQVNRMEVFDPEGGKEREDEGSLELEQELEQEQEQEQEHPG
jgi:phenylpropionate dioxygenase-like ring-hydroxylating dioxygenase large terminal subunit